MPAAFSARAEPLARNQSLDSRGVPRFVFFDPPGQRKDIPGSPAGNLKTVDHAYPRIRIDLVLVKGHFGPELIERLSRRFGVPKNYMFIGTPGDRFPHTSPTWAACA